MAGHFLIVEADFYAEISALQKQGAIAALIEAGASYEVISVPGAFEIPAAIAFMATRGELSFDGYVALGCVIRGETSHYEIICTESARALMDITINRNLAIGNGILTVENSQQAFERADKDRKDKGGEAARAALTMADLKLHYQAREIS